MAKKPATAKAGDGEAIDLNQTIQWLRAQGKEHELIARLADAVESGEQDAASAWQAAIAYLKAIDLSDDDHGPDGEIRPEVQARVDEEQRQFMAQRKVQWDEDAKAERDAQKGRQERATARRQEAANTAEAVRALVEIVADIEKRLQAKGI